MTRKKTTRSKGKTPSRRGKRSAPPPPSRGNLLRQSAGWAALIVGALTTLSWLTESPAAMTMRGWSEWLLGGLSWLLGPLLALFGLWLLAGMRPLPLRRRRAMGILLLLLALFAVGGYWQATHPYRPTDQYGGALALQLYSALNVALGTVGALLLSGAALLVGTLMLIDRPPARLKPQRGRNDRTPSEAETPVLQPSFFDDPPPPSVTRPSLATRLHEGLARIAAALRNGWQAAAGGANRLRAASAAPTAAPPRYHRRPESHWELPPWREMLEDVDLGPADDEELRQKSRTIEKTLAAFGVPGNVVAINRGPTVTQYGVAPGIVRKVVRGTARESKVRVSAIAALRNDLALALSAPTIRIEAPVPGHAYVGIEVPNDQSSAVTLRNTMESEEFESMRGALPLALGRDVMGNAVIADLARMPHLLIAGATGSGKSVCINSILCCLLCQHTPDELRLLLVDPKRVELIGYNGIPHLLVPVVIEIEKVLGLLRWTLTEMERRYKLFSEQKVRNLESYNAKMRLDGETPLPYLVLVIDEMADLMMASPEQVETMLCRLAQMARATGIHMVLATQRPSVNVVTGLIKANFPARIAFSVASQIDSRVILDRPGAESLLGQGDMLFQAPDAGAAVRAQGSFVSEEELAALNRFWLRQSERPRKPKRQSAEKVIVPKVTWEELIETKRDEADELLAKARELVQEEGHASISLLQRRLRVGYARAARLVDLMEEEGTIGKHVGPGKLRTVHENGEDTTTPVRDYEE
ncbi:MAG: DNA translocase FtsK [Ardenticatenales bacterium]|nr:DNA translocase FtsK [Ardenticatenales bacterium]